MITPTLGKPAATAARSGGRWGEVREEFLAAMDASQRPQVMLRLGDPHYGGRGLRQWLSALVAGTGRLPPAIPPQLVQVYLADDEAVPLHDCAGCGLAIPVRPGRDWDEAGEPQQLYFPRCPGCGGATGRYARLCGRYRGAEPE